HVGTRAERRQRVRELLEVVGLSPAHARRYPHELSGGQRQRVGLARALALSPAVIVADEAVSALDVSIRAQIINLLQQLQQELGSSYLFIARALGVVRPQSDRVAVMYLGQIVEQGGAADLYTDPRHPYTVSLLSAVPVPDPAAEGRRERIILPGDPPNPAEPPPGCRFHTRCWLREQLGGPVPGAGAGGSWAARGGGGGGGRPSGGPRPAPPRPATSPTRCRGGPRDRRPGRRPGRPRERTAPRARAGPRADPGRGGAAVRSARLPRDDHPPDRAGGRDPAALAVPSLPVQARDRR